MNATDDKWGMRKMCDNVEAVICSPHTHSLPAHHAPDKHHPQRRFQCRRRIVSNAFHASHYSNTGRSLLNEAKTKEKQSSSKRSECKQGGSCRAADKRDVSVGREGPVAVCWSLFTCRCPRLTYH